MKRIPIDEATASQLADFATLNLGIADVNFRMGAAAILAKIAAVGYSADTIEVADGPASQEPNGMATQPVDKAPNARRMVTIRIDTTEGPGGDKPVPVGVNGKVMLIPRGKEVKVPYEYYHALQNAKMLIRDPKSDGLGGTLPPREVMSYPVSLVA